ncbi:hypothetical protein C0Z16_20660 [Paraburkholderia rhynchosiae]|uniref:Uncharacterized protein n=1 Tax=Paraburkholderia rhynchosiae TaxID=487049 RepID=A0ABX4V1Z3_9BURK|nr:hypothetical protein C0Z16_20660 [Paraburkholderia rhynchosiae]
MPDALTGAGLELRQAEALASALHDLFGPSRATRADLRLITAELAGALEKTKVRLVISQRFVAVTRFVALKFIHWSQSSTEQPATAIQAASSNGARKQVLAMCWAMPCECNQLQWVAT